MLVPYNQSSSAQFYEDHYNGQRGGGIPVFSGRSVMQGGGIGNVFGSIFRAIAPVLKKGAAHIGKRAISTGAAIAGDVLSGKNVKRSIKGRTSAAGKGLLDDALGVLTTSARPRKRAGPRANAVSKRRRVARRGIF